MCLCHDDDPYKQYQNELVAARLLIPSGSRLLDVPELRGVVGPFDGQTLTYRWAHADPRVDALPLAGAVKVEMVLTLIDRKSTRLNSSHT